jgi:hypothetical protein
MLDYGYLTPDNDIVPADMRKLEQLIPYYIDDSGEVCVVWPLGTYETRDRMDELVRRYTWRIYQNLNDMKANAFQLMGGISDKQTIRLRDLIAEMDKLVAEIRQE